MVEIRSEKSSYNEAGTSGGRSKEKQDAHLEDAEEEIEMPVAFDVCRPLSRISESANEELVHSILHGNDGMMLSVKSEVTSPELLQRELRESEKEEDMETELRLNIATQRMIEEIHRKKQLKRKRMSKKLYRSLPSSSSSSSTSSSASSSSSSSSESDSTEDDSSETDERRRKRSKSGRGRKSKSKRHRRDKGKKRKKKRRRRRRSGKKKRKARDSTYSSEVSSGSSESGTHVGMKKSAARGNIMLPKISEESSDSSSKSLESILRNSLEKDLGGFSSLGGRNKENAVVYKKSEMDLANLPPYFPAIDGCRNVNEYEILEKIAEGSYGVVHKAKDKQTDETVALKKLKMEKETEGFPITSLREINTLLKAQHPNIVTVREIVVNTNIDKIYIVMDYIEHDLKSFMEDMKKKKEVFLPEDVKCLMLQLLRAVAHLHDNWILHRDLKTSNLLLSNRGILKVGDFGLAREYGSPLKPYSPVVVTLWYRAPEILLGTRKYSTSVDVWSVGCIFSELITMETLFQSKTEVEQINRIFRALGTPNEKVWSGFNMLPAIQHIKVTNYPPGRLWKQFNNKVTYNGMLLLQRFLTFDPVKRIAAREAQDHDYFKEAPLPAAPEEFAAMHNADDTCHKTSLVPSPKVELDYNGADEDTQEGFFMSKQESNRKEVSTTFRLRF